MGRFKPATRKKLKLRMAIDGPSGAGKTYTGLRFAFTLGRRVAVIDTENRSASKYKGDSPDGVPFDFDVAELTNYAPTEYTSAIQEAGREGFDVIVIDSLSHAWVGEGGALDLKDRQGGNSFTAWAKITPMQRRMVDAIQQSPCHVIATMRSKTEYLLEQDEKGRMVPRKIGMAPVQRDGMEYEFDIYGSMDWTHTLTITKSRCPLVADAVSVKPSAGFLDPVIRWLESGTVIENRPAQSTDEATARIQARTAAIRDLLAKLGTRPEMAIVTLKTRYGVETFEELTDAQAAEIVATMEGKLRQQSAPATSPAQNKNEKAQEKAQV